MKNIKISQENPERFKNPRFYYTYVDANKKRHKKISRKRDPQKSSAKSG